MVEDYTLHLTTPSSLVQMMERVFHVYKVHVGDQCVVTQLNDLLHQRVLDRRHLLEGTGDMGLPNKHSL